MRRKEEARVQGSEFRTVRLVTAIVLAAAMAVVPKSLQSEGEWEVATPDYEWDFPRDHWARDGFKTEWWYFTGHLEADGGERFAYQFTFFRIGLLRERPDVQSDWGTKDLIMGHAALSTLSLLEPFDTRPSAATQDRQGSRGAGAQGRKIKTTVSASHRFSEVLYRAVPLLGGFGTFPDSVIAWSRAPAGTEGTWKLKWNGEAFDFEAEDNELGFSFSLATRPVKSLILQGPNGYSRKGAGESAASQYYSFTRLATVGTIEVDGQIHQVKGQSWMDKEFSTHSLGRGQVGWDWFSLQLDDGRELMLYVLRNAEGNVDTARGTLVESDAQVSYFGRDAFEIIVNDSWTSPSGDSYPSEWRIRHTDASLDLVVRPQMADQENRSKLIPTLRYWEGAVDVTSPEGKRVGVGFVEMTGYGSATTPVL